MRRLSRVLLATGTVLGAAVSGYSAPVILNEYNAVSNTNFLGSGASDVTLGTIQGNGRNWVEMVVIQDHLDMRGWILSWADTSVSGSMTLSNDSLWSDLRSGTIITMTGMDAANSGYDTDASYDPINGDWWFNIFAGESQYVSSSSTTAVGDGIFSVSHSNWQMTIKDSLNVAQFGPAGEGVSPASGVGSDEVWKLEADPSASILPSSTSYKDGTSSSFGAPNRWSGGTFTQDFSALRSVVPEPAALSGLLAGLMVLARRRRQA